MSHSTCKAFLKIRDTKVIPGVSDSVSVGESYAYMVFF